MSVRTTRSTATFRAPFRLAGLKETLPAGAYTIETDEDVLEGNDRTVYRRTATLMVVTSAGASRTVTIDPAELERALAADRRG